MNEINQLVLDCMARVLRINQTTDAEISFQLWHPSMIECHGWKNGYANAAAEQNVESPDYDFDPLNDAIYLRYGDPVPELKQLLSSLDVLEKELINAK